MLRVGIVQLDVSVGQPEKNYARVAELVEKTMASPEPPEVLVLPELWTMGYALNRTSELYPEAGEEAAARFLGNLARRYGVWFAGGSVLGKVEGGFSNRAQVIDPEGRVVEKYDKVHLIGLMDEDKYLRPGRDYGMFQMDGISCASVICYDIRFCEFIRKNVLMGARILFVGAEWPEIRIGHWRTLLQARAIENQIFVVACNRCGTSGKTVFGGASMVIDPWGEVLYDGGTSEDVGIVTIDPSKVDEVRKAMPVFEDRVPEIY